MLKKKWTVKTRKADFVVIDEENLLAESEVKMLLPSESEESTYS